MTVFGYHILHYTHGVYSAHVQVSPELLYSIYNTTLCRCAHHKHGACSPQSTISANHLHLIYTYT